MAVYTKKQWHLLRAIWSAINDTADAVPEKHLAAAVDEIGALLGAAGGFILVSERDRHLARLPDDPLEGWRAGPVMQFGANIEQRKVAMENLLLADEAYKQDKQAHELASSAGVPRAVLRSDIVSESARFEGITGEYMKAVGVTDRCVAGIPINEDREFYFGFDRMKGDRNFDVDERDIALGMLPALIPLARRFAMTFSRTPAHPNLTPRERDTLHAMLTGRSEKEAAGELGVTARTFHQYVVAVYRKFGVRSRPELMSLFIHPK